MSIEEIISRLEFVACAIDGKKGAKVLCGALDAKALRSAVTLLRTHPDAQPNEPLTLSELLEVRGGPAWLQSKKKKDLGRWVIINEVDPKMGFVSFDGGVLINLEDWRDEMDIYRRPPKEG